MSISFILLLILTLVRFWIALQLFLTARKSHLNNLYWLAGMFVLAIYTLFAPTSTSPASTYPIFHLGFLAGHFCLAIFIHTTFYHHRKSPIFIVLGLFMLAVIVDIYAFATNRPGLAGLMVSVGLINWIWHFIVARAAYLKITADQHVENWVKSRYKLMMAYVVMMMLVTIQLVVFTSSTSLPVVPIILVMGLLVVIASTILQFLVWAMPESFRLWLSHAERPSIEEQTQPISVLNVFGAAMAADTGLNTIACFYAIRSAIGKEIGTENSEAIRNHIKIMTYRDWEIVLQEAELHRILMNGGANNTIADKAIENARRALTEKQSLLTFSTR